MSQRSTTIRDHLRKRIGSRRDPCHICGNQIDYTLPYLHPESFVVDHVIPLARGGTNAIENAAAAHRACNRAKSDLLPEEMNRRREVLAAVSSSPIW